MPKRSNDFQKLVALINGCLRTSGKVTESALLPDKVTGEDHEVDVLISSEVGGYPVNISIEVVDRKRKAGSPWVNEMYGKHTHLPTDKLILVSRNGFTAPALEKARFLRIETITFDEAFETDWDVATRLSAEGFFSVTMMNYKCTAVCDHPDGQKVYSPVKRSTPVFMPSRETPTDFDKMMEAIRDDPNFKDRLDEQLENTSERTFSLIYTPPVGTYVLHADRTKMPLRKVTFEIEVDYTKAPVRYAIGRYGEKEVVSGASRDPSVPLQFAFVRKEGGSDEGLLLDEKGLRKLSRS